MNRLCPSLLGQSGFRLEYIPPCGIIKKGHDPMQNKSFLLVVLGQIISLFGNATVRFALPLHLLNVTGSSALFGAVTACAFLPAILLSPVGGMVADRVNKRNIMVLLDFATAALVLLCTLLLDLAPLIPLLIVTLMLLYGIAGAYQPAVQASIPALVPPEQYVQANAVVNTVNAFSALLGPVLGGVLYSAWGLAGVLILCGACFALSAGMECFLHIPFTPPPKTGGFWTTVRTDFVQSLHLLRREVPAAGQGMLVICGMNLFLSAMIVVGVPYLVTQVLDLGDPALTNRLCGFAQGALAAGGLAGGALAGIFARHLHIQRAGDWLLLCALAVFPLGAALLLPAGAWIQYGVLLLSCFVVMVSSNLFTVQLMAFLQKAIPGAQLGKVLAVVMTVSMCAHPLGSGLYGLLFEACGGFEWAAVCFSGGMSLLLGLRARQVFRRVGD